LKASTSVRAESEEQVISVHHEIHQALSRFEGDVAQLKEKVQDGQSN
jgi:hypothetical protein